MYIIPKPQALEERTGEFLLTYKTVITIAPNCGKNGFFYGKLLKETIEHRTGFSLSLVKGDARTGDISLLIQEDMDAHTYQLEISESDISIKAGSEESLLYGVQTLRQIIDQQAGCLGCILITDFPEISARGFYHDATRGRVPTLKALKKLADKMSYYKMNQLQLYIEHTYLFRDFSEVWRDETPMTAEEVMELDEYCMARHIELVPSLASFGHMYQILRSQSYVKYCELPELQNQSFSFQKRMHHHTVDVSNDQTLVFIKKMLLEYLHLFSSDKFNFCADETFDLGKGRSKALADEKGTNQIYIDYVKELGEFLLQHGKTPMFWGDIILGFPEMIKQLPKEMICLNWGYSSAQNEDGTRIFAEVGANQYVCPGAGGWNEWLNLNYNAYLNISKMCSYAKKYNAIGLLNTDWGDFGHINTPEFSIPGMIYGAAFSWNSKIDSFEEINKQISILEYTDSTASFLSTLAKIENCCIFGWYHAVTYVEVPEYNGNIEDSHKFFKEKDRSKIAEADNKLVQAQKELTSLLTHMDPERRYIVPSYTLIIDGVRIFNMVGAVIAEQEFAGNADLQIDRFALAERLEVWFMNYKELWRSVSKEGDLDKIARIVFWYADYLRKVKKA